MAEIILLIVIAGLVLGGALFVVCRIRCLPINDEGASINEDYRDF